ncbi:MAG: hypothetical protein Kow0047_23420 [Anaerolineae bacterium]
MTWPGVPTFAGGAALSARGHLNRLSAAARHLFGIRRGTWLAFSGQRTVELYTSAREIWRGAIRHRYGTVVCRVRLYHDEGGAIRIVVKYDGQIVLDETRSPSGAQMFALEGDASTMTVGQFYTVTVEAYSPDPYGHCVSCYGEVLEVAETESVPLPTLATPVDGVTFTAQQWQAYADYLELLYQHHYGTPVAGFPERWGLFQVGAELFRGGIVHRRGRLFYRAWRNKERRGTGHKITVYVNDVQVDVIDDSTPVTTDADILANPWEEASDRYDCYERYVDLSALGLNETEVYRVYVIQNEGEGPLAEWAKAAVDFVAEAPTDPPDLSDGVSTWPGVPTWHHGNVVEASGGQGFWMMRAALEWLAELALPINTACREKYDDKTVRRFGFWFQRRHRYLHYYSRQAAEPVVRVYWNGAWQDFNLSPESGWGWYVLDLDSIPGLSIGRWYRVLGATYALEDREL